jgi:hypothetical protein
MNAAKKERTVETIQNDPGGAGPGQLRASASSPKSDVETTYETVTRRVESLDASGNPVVTESRIYTTTRPRETKKLVKPTVLHSESVRIVASKIQAPMKELTINVRSGNWVRVFVTELPKNPLRTLKGPESSVYVSPFADVGHSAVTVGTRKGASCLAKAYHPGVFRATENAKLLCSCIGDYDVMAEIVITDLEPGVSHWVESP